MILAAALALVVVIGILPVAALRWVNPPGSAFMLRWRLSQPTPVSHRWAKLEDISPELRLAVVAAEDQKFPFHRGFDLAAIGDAIEERRVRARLRGASTITQQTAKNLFLWPGRSWVRKSLEAWLTAWIELLWPKSRILEVYLNVAQFGPGVFGAESAAYVYFDEPAAALDASQAALLAAVLPDPVGLRISEPSAYLRERQAWILAQMNGLGGPAYLGF